VITVNEIKQRIESENIQVGSLLKKLSRNWKPCSTKGQASLVIEEQRLRERQ